MLKIHIKISNVCANVLLKMKIKSLLVCLLLCNIFCNAQLLSWSPAFITDTTSTVTITCDATQGNLGLNNYTPTSDVYVHIGLITSSSTSSSNWLHVPSFSTWGSTNPQIQTTYLGNNKWQYTITGGLRTFFGVTSSSETVSKIAILFRSGNGSLKQANIDGSDMYVPVYSYVTASNLLVRLDAPFRQPLYTPALVPLTKKIGDNVSITANTNQNATINLFFNGTQVGSTATNTQTASASATITSAGTQTIVAQANNGTSTTSDTSTFFISSSNTFAALPSGIVDGINYEAGDTSVVLVLYAPHKSQIVVVGDFNNWTQSSAYQMNETPDSLRYWLRIKGLTAGKEYAYQYVIDGSLIVADYNAEKILDKANDPYISTTTYPNLKVFPSAASGNIVSVLQTAKPAYNWQVTNFIRPDKRNLSIYELWVGNFTAAQNYQALKDTLTYLKRLGINAIELMPVNEFEGNISWGYNPNFYFAPDKYYGTENALRQFIDACHQQGIAVIMDMVLNHSFGSSPMVQMYWNSALNIPTANSPWFSQYYTHAFDVGIQFNNSSDATKQFRERVINHWLKNYHIDGYRFDLAKGFTPTNTCDASGNNCNVTTWGNYDQQRVNIWDTLYNYQQSVSPGSYCILEMFADNSEEVVEANYGMMIWGNLHSNFNQVTMGYSNPSWDLSSGVYTNRGYNSPNLITYQESHDEERLMYNNEVYGNGSGSYNTKDTATGLNRNAMAASFWAMIPGPKMMWQFGELGFDYSINTCSDLTINNNCRLSQKPLVWNYYSNANRLGLYNVYSKLLNLRNTPKYINTFTTGTINYNLANAFKSLVVTSDSLSLVVIGNVDVIPQTGSVTFPTAGTWYSYLTSATHTATGASESITLQPGEYYVYTNKNLNNSVVTAIAPVSNDINSLKISITPNPVYSSANIIYTLPENGVVNISVLGLDGRKVANLFNGFKTKGIQTLSLNGNGLNTAQLGKGMYLLEIQENGKRRTEKFILIN